MHAGQQHRVEHGYQRCPGAPGSAGIDDEHLCPWVHDGVHPGECSNLHGAMSPLGPHPGGPTTIPVTRRHRNPVTTDSFWSRKSRGYTETQERCHPGVLPRRPRTSITGFQFEPADRTPKHASERARGRHSPHVRKPGTPLGPSTDFRMSTRYLPASRMRSRGIDRWV